MTSRPFRRLRTAALVLPIAALALTGCSVGLTDGGAPELQSENTAPPVEQEAPETEETDAGDDSGVDTSGLPTRAEIAALVTKQVTCSGGSLDITDMASVVEVVGDCANLTISGDASVVLAGKVGDLNVEGLQSVVLVASADSIVVSGDASTILWESGSPSVDDSSLSSVLLGVGAR